MSQCTVWYGVYRQGNIAAAQLSTIVSMEGRRETVTDPNVDRCWQRSGPCEKPKDLY